MKIVYTKASVEYSNIFDAITTYLNICMEILPIDQYMETKQKIDDEILGLEQTWQYYQLYK